MYKHTKTRSDSEWTSVGAELKTMSRNFWKELVLLCVS